jgi:hypothetical protein
MLAGVFAIMAGCRNSVGNFSIVFVWIAGGRS